LEELSDDCSEKSDNYELPYAAYKVAFLIEVLIFYWPHEETRELTTNRLAETCAAFCASCDNRIADSLVSLIAPIWPKEVVRAMSGKIHRLSAPCLEFFYQMELDKLEGFRGDKEVMVLKLMPRMKKVAEKLLRDIPNQSATLRAALRQFNPKTGHYGGD
jgi:hypothetical protein